MSINGFIECEEMREISPGSSLSSSTKESLAADSTTNKVMNFATEKLALFQDEKRGRTGIIAEMNDFYQEISGRVVWERCEAKQNEVRGKEQKEKLDRISHQENLERNQLAQNCFLHLDQIIKSAKGAELTPFSYEIDEE